MSTKPPVMFPLPSAVKLPTLASYPPVAEPPFIRNAYCPFSTELAPVPHVPSTM